MNLNLEGKHALVCGSTQGIGLAIAQSLADEDVRVTLLARSEDSLKKALSTLSGVGHDYLVADFADFADLSSLTDNIRSGEFHILINNSGGPSPGLVKDADWNDFDTAISMHLKSSHHLMQCVLPTMKSQGYGRIINVISTSVRIPIQGLGVSNTVRGAMASWSKTLSNEIAQFGITVNNILPGPIETQRLKAIIIDTAEKKGISEEEVENNMKMSVPARRFGKPEEIGAMVAFLCSEQAGYINGINIPVDGGRTGSI